MKTIKFDKLLKISILLFLGYSFFLFHKIASNSDNGRFQFNSDASVIIDTRTGKLFTPEDGPLNEIKE